MDTRVSLVPSFFPDSVIERLKSGKAGGNTESFMIKMTKLLVNVMEGTASQFEDGKYTLFDANPGDFGCQNQALELGRIAGLDLRDEFSELSLTSQKMKSAYIQRTTAKGKVKKNQCSPFDFFMDQCDLRVSQEIGYLLHCYLGTKMRVAVETLENGVVLTQSNCDRIGGIVGNTRCIGSKILRDILMKNQEQLSARSVAAVEGVARTLTMGDEAEKELMVRMLSLKKIRVIPGYRPKTFGCLFFEIKTLAFMVRETQKVICLRKILREGETAMRIFMQSQVSGDRLEIIPVGSVSAETPVIVFESVVKGTLEEVCEEIVNSGFTNLLLQDAAFAPPYDPKSTIEDIRDSEGLAEIQCFYNLGRPKTFAIDHIYLSRKKGSGLCQEGRPWIVV